MTQAFPRMLTVGLGPLQHKAHDWRPAARPCDLGQGGTWAASVSTPASLHRRWTTASLPARAHARHRQAAHILCPVVCYSFAVTCDHSAIVAAGKDGASWQCGRAGRRERGDGQGHSSGGRAYRVHLVALSSPRPQVVVACSQRAPQSHSKRVLSSCASPRALNLSEVATAPAASPREAQSSAALTARECRAGRVRRARNEEGVLELGREHVQRLTEGRLQPHTLYCLHCPFRRCAHSEPFLSTPLCQAPLCGRDKPLCPSDNTVLSCAPAQALPARTWSSLTSPARISASSLNSTSDSSRHLQGRVDQCTAANTRHKRTSSLSTSASPHTRYVLLRFTADAQRTRQYHCLFSL
jgi:hypothetical protein